MGHLRPAGLNRAMTDLSAPDSSVRAVCRACGGGVRPKFRARDYNRLASDEIFSYSECIQCGVISLQNVPLDLDSYYVPGYYQQPTTDAAIEAGATHEQYKIDLVKQFVSGGRLLEIGPSWGAFCLLAKRAGFSVEAIEMNSSCCEFLTARIGIRAFCRSDEAAAIQETSSPDVIAAWHVLEHLQNPWELVDAAAAHLSPGGILILALPNPRALQFKILGRYWAHLDAPRHLHLVPPDALRKRAEAAGLKQVLCTTTDAGSLGWNEFGWVYSLQHVASGTFAKRVLRFAGRKISAALALVESREGLGSAYTAVFRKPT